MEGSYIDANGVKLSDGEVYVSLSYENVRALYEAMQHMQRSSHNVFTLSKTDQHGTKTTVLLPKE